MLQKNTTIVLGAGSSKPFGLPLGSELKTEIASAIYLYFDDFGQSLKRGSHEVANTFRVLASRDDESRGDINPYLKAGRDIAEALPVCSSIDDYIERNSGHKVYEVCAKIAIAHCILRAERKSDLCPDPHKIATPDISQFGGCWIDELLQAATRGCNSADLPMALGRLNIINFNYDRCFEHFTFFWIKRVYKISDAAAWEAMRNISLVHPYGSLGPIPGITAEPGIPFGYQPRAEELLKIALNIRTYSESERENDRTAAIKEMMNTSKNIIFLGFAFHAQNMNLLSISAPPSRPFARHAYASAFGISDVRWNLVKDRMAKSLSVTSEHLFAQKENESCEKLIQEFSDYVID